MGEKIEDHQVQDEEQRDGADELDAIDPVCDGAVDRDQNDKEHGLKGRGVTLELRATRG